MSEHDWTTDPETGRSNSSPLYLALFAEVARLIRDGAAGSVLKPEWVNGKAGLIVAQLAHVHHLVPAAFPAPARTALREHIRAERAAQDEAAAEHAEYGRTIRSERAYGAVEALDRLLGVMDQMEAGQ